MAGEEGGIPWYVNIIIYTGGVLAAVVAALIGGRRKGETAGEREDRKDADRIAAIEEELAREKERRNRDRTDRDVAEAQRQTEEKFELILKSLREGFESQIKKINRQLAGMRRQIGRLSPKQLEDRES
jgi:hypothetical protein